MTYTVQVENAEQENNLINFLKERKIEFQKDGESDFDLTEEMKSLIEERLKEDRSKAHDAWNVLKEIRAKYDLQD